MRQKSGFLTKISPLKSIVKAVGIGYDRFKVNIDILKEWIAL